VNLEHFSLHPPESIINRRLQALFVANRGFRSGLTLNRQEVVVAAAAAAATAAAAAAGLVRRVATFTFALLFVSPVG